MYELTVESAADYLRTQGRLATDEQVAVERLRGGVSSTVLLVISASTGERFVLKQPCGRLNVEQPWLASQQRAGREVESLRLARQLIAASDKALGTPHNGGPPAASFAAEFKPLVPEVLWEDQDNCLFAMSAAPVGHRVWKEMLLAGETRMGLGIATTCGRLLATLHAGSWNNARIGEQLEDRRYFDELRIDPYYQHLARKDSALASVIEQLIESVWQHRCCLVHGDFSPKNLLVWSGHLMLIDFEVGHYGDPAFDLGFFLTHLALKSCWAGARRGEYIKLATVFWNTYQLVLSQAVSASEWTALEGRAMWNLGGCMLARVDGKSPVDYLSADDRVAVRRLATAWLQQPPPTWAAAAESLAAQ